LALRIIKNLLAGSVLSLFVWASVLAGAISQGYHSNIPLSEGTIVSAVKNSNKEIEKTNLENESLLAGIVTNDSKSVISLQPKGTDIGVVVNGEVNLLVTDINGDIEQGDYLIISPLAGVAMKDSLNSQAKKYIAVAAQSFNKKSAGVKPVPVELNNGQHKDVSVGIMLANLVLSNRVDKANSKQNTVLVFAQRIAGKPVNNIRLISSVAVFMSTLFLTGLLLNGSIKGSFISLGRNPLSKTIILNNLFRIIAFGIVILTAGTAISYTILRI